MLARIARIARLLCQEFGLKVGVTPEYWSREWGEILCRSAPYYYPPSPYYLKHLVFGRERHSHLEISAPKVASKGRIRSLLCQDFEPIWQSRQSKDRGPIG
jgi:hypothetical protein